MPVLVKDIAEAETLINTKCYTTMMILLLMMTMISIILNRMRATTRRVTGLYLSIAADKARQRPWRRPSGSKAARQAGMGWSPLGGGLGSRRAPMAVIVTGQSNSSHCLAKFEVFCYILKQNY